MSYTLSTVDKLFVVRWQETLERDLFELGPKLERFAASVGVGKVFYVSISDDETPAPTDSAKRALVTFTEAHIHLMEHMYIVIAASGFRGSTLRGALAGMMLLSRQRKVVTVEKSLDDVLHHVHRSLSLPLAEVRRSLSRDGVLAATA